MPESDYARIEKAILFLQAHFRRQPRLGEIASHVGVSEYHFQRLFRRWAGISPKRFLQYLTGDYVEQLLRESHSLLEASLDAGLSGPGRLHDLMINLHGVTPGELKRQGSGLLIRYGIHPSPFGDCLIATTTRGICALEFHPRPEMNEALLRLKRHWPGAVFSHDREATACRVKQIFNAPGNRRPGVIDLFVQGSNFQLKVWEALLRIPAGQLISYLDVAKSIGRPSASRAIGGANGKNPVAFLIPCHRVIRQSGSFSEYRWGTARKQAIYAWERASLEHAQEGQTGV